jgi:small subunit ribosomal protein S19
MVKKIFSYRGKKLEELQSMSFRELAELFTSRVRRSMKRGFTDAQKKFLKKTENKKVVKTHFRTMPILPHMVGKTIKVYNGKEFLDVIVVPEMIGHTLGEFSPTRKRTGHSTPGVGKKDKKK